MERTMNYPVKVNIWSDPETLVMRKTCKTWDEIMTMIENAGSQFPVFIHVWGTDYIYVPERDRIEVDITVGE